eukprot:scaffold9713_cov103-Isochrysis_galbana.AAC.4
MPPASEKHDAAIGVQKAREAEDRLAGCGILRQVEGLRDGNIEPAVQDLLLGLPVIDRLNQLHLQSRLRKKALSQGDD